MGHFSCTYWLFVCLFVNWLFMVGRIDIDIKVLLWLTSCSAPPVGYGLCSRRAVTSYKNTCRMGGCTWLCCSCYRDGIARALPHTVLLYKVTWNLRPEAARMSLPPGSCTLSYLCARVCLLWMIEAFWELSVSQRYKNLLWPRAKWEPYGCVAWVVFRAIVGCLAWTVPFHLELRGVKCWRLWERAFEPHYPSGVPCDSSVGHLLLPEETPDLCMWTGGNTSILG